MTKQKDHLKINGTVVKPGQKKVIEVPIGSLPSGNEINMRVFVYRGEEKGPVALVLAGIHGDEVNGVEIVKRSIAGNYFDSLIRGTVLAIPLVNIYGFINFSRSLPDGKDVNRSFPGNSRGSLASRVAHAVTKKILPHIDFGIDFHTGGRSHYNYPQIRFTPEDEEARKLASAFAPPYLIEKSAISKSLRLIAMKSDKPILVFEGGENLRYDGLSITRGLDGLKRLLIHNGMLPGELPERKPILIRQSSWLRASQPGMFLWYKCSGNKVFKDEPIGEINTPYGDSPNVIRAPKEAYIVGHNNAPVVNLGDALFHLGVTEPKKERQ